MQSFSDLNPMGLCVQVFGTLTPPLIAWLYPPHVRRCRSDASDRGLSPKASLEHDSTLIPLLMDTNRDEGDDAEHGAANGNMPLNQYFRDLTRLQSLSALLTAPRSTIHHVWRKFDDAYMRPTFGGRGYVRLMSRRVLEPPQEDEDLEDEDQN